MAREITNEKGLITLTDTEDLDSNLCNRDIAPTTFEERHWSTFNITSLWVGIAVCIPTYMLASYMITDGLSWMEALFLIFLGNLIVSVPMAFNGHAGTKYGIPFPVLGRASFGTKGVHIPSILRSLVACGWFGVQTWMGGLAIFYILFTLFSIPDTFMVKFACFIAFWFINIYFIWKGTESIKFLEAVAAPLLLIIGLGLLYWGISNGGGLANVLSQSEKLNKPTVQSSVNNGEATLIFNLINDKNGEVRAKEYRTGSGEWQPIPAEQSVKLAGDYKAGDIINVSFRARDTNNGFYETVPLPVTLTETATTDGSMAGRMKKYIFWLTAMVGFWATLALNIPDLTRFARGQKEQVTGQFLGLPTTMVLYSFIGIAVTCAAILIFPDILIKEAAPWDPVNLIAKLDNPAAIVFAQCCLLIATLSTNIAANVIAPANSFANAFPKYISFRAGGVIAGVIGIIICPWWLINQISGFLLNYSAVLGPLVAVMLADYYTVRKTKLELLQLYTPDGIYSYGGSGFNKMAIIAFLSGVAVTYLYVLFPAFEILHSSSWFSGFIVSYVVYVLLMRTGTEKLPAGENLSLSAE